MMEFNIIAVTKLAAGVCIVWLIAMGSILLYLKHEKHEKEKKK